MSADDDFIASGLKYYAEALRTTAYFRRQIEQRLRLFVGQWPGSQRVVPEPAKMDISAAPFDSPGPWIVCWCPVHVDGGDAALEVGIWWMALDEVVAYASFTHGPDWLRRALDPRAGKGIRVEKSGAYRHFICGLTGGDLEGAWGRLLEELLVAVDRTRPPQGSTQS